jgi:cellulose synthase/poly-beta-1,6-N-acetylglucosamine synthase-like glycosyltransferase
MSTPLDMFFALGPGELYLLFWLSIIMDFPRYFLSVFAAVIAPGRYPEGETAYTASAVVACYNEASSIAACVAALKAAGADQIIVVNDGSTDDTLAVTLQLVGVVVINNPERLGKAASVNVALTYCTGDLILIADADTILTPDAIAKAKPYFLDAKVAGVGVNLGIRNATASLTTRLQAIEYAITFTAGRMFADALGVLPNISGAAGLFRRSALEAIGGLDIEVAEDAALAMKLRRAGWRLRHASNALAWTAAPDEPATLALQRLRWDASIITIYWRKFGGFINPFARDLNGANLLTSLDVLVFSVAMQMAFPIYLGWVWSRVGWATTFVLLAAVMIGLLFADVIILLLVRLPPRLVAYAPLYIVIQTAIMRPLRVFALVGELAFSITKYDDYVPRSQRGRLT